MGLRGPGAKPTPRLTVVASRDCEPPRWQRSRLSRADRVIAFVESLQITQGKGAGGPFKLRPWQKDIVRALYRDGVREALVTMGRKNGKTELAAALTLAHLCGPEAEPRGEVYSAAADREQAGRIFRSCEAFIFADPGLASRVNVKRFEKTLEVMSGPGEGSIYRALSSDATKAHGLNPSFAVADELAQWKHRELYDNIRTGFGARERQLLLVISTRSSDPNSVMSEVTRHGEDVRDGVVEDESFAAVIYDTPVAKDPDEHRAQMVDEECWKAANPALGDFLSVIDMRKEAELARRIPAREAAFRNLKLNQPVDAEERLITGPDWMACRCDVMPDLRGRPCWAGLDLSSTVDLTALVLYFPEDGGWIVPFFWVPKDRLEEREQRDHVPYKLWHSQGLIEAPDGRAIDKNSIALRLAEINQQYDVRGIAYDRWRIEDLLKTLDDEGIALPLEPWGMGYASMGPAVDAFERGVLDRALRHDGNPVMTWNISNVLVQTDPAGNRKPSKERSREKIDGAVALMMAIGLHAKAPPVVERRMFRAGALERMVQPCA